MSFSSASLEAVAKMPEVLCVMKSMPLSIEVFNAARAGLEAGREKWMSIYSMCDVYLGRLLKEGASHPGLLR
jgi:hypothetical protein